MPSDSKIRFEFGLRRVRRLSRLTLLGKVAVKLLACLFGLALLPVSLLLHLGGFRHVNIFTDRVGHLALEPDCLLKEQFLGNIPHRKWIMLAPKGRVANEHLLTYWGAYFYIIRSRFVCFLIASMSNWGMMRYDVGQYARVFDRPQKSFKVYAEWGERLPLLTLIEEDVSWGDQKLRELDLPENSWFVCVHAREGGFSSVDEELHSHRNSSIENMTLAIDEIVQRGGWVIRLGDSTMAPLPSMPKVIDYAHHPLKSERLDVILCARAKFILGSTSGICLIGSLFGVPAAIANMVPTADRWYGMKDISIPKRIWSQRESRYLSISEMLGYAVGCYRYAKQYEDLGLDLVENCPEDIKDLACEMMDALDNHSSEWEIRGDPNLIISSLDERCASFYSIAQVGKSFLRKYENAPLTLKN